MASANPSYVGHYRLLNVVNTGQTSRIWQAYDDRAEELVGIKVLLEKFRRQREHIRSLRWEYEVTRKMDNPHLIHIREYSANRGNPYVAMEWFAAPNLKQLIRAGVDRIQHLAPSIIQQAAEALIYFNSWGWVHRDVKPDNFLVSADGHVKLIDFSLAIRKRTGLLKLLPTKLKVQGTRSYMSPEQILGKALDQRADLYSLGCTIYELLAGKPPFTGVSAHELLMKHMRASPPALEAANSNVTPEFAQLIRSAMAKAPKLRPASIEDFLNSMRMIRIFKQTPRPPEGGKSA